MVKFLANCGQRGFQEPHMVTWTLPGPHVGLELTFPAPHCWEHCIAPVPAFQSPLPQEVCAALHPAALKLPAGRTPPGVP